MPTIYCPYTDADIPETAASSEHIIPLSLGGGSGFTIPVDKDFNSMIGSKLDGPLAKEFLWVLQRTEYDARGHSRKEPFATSETITNHDADGRQVLVKLHKRKGVQVWDVRQRKRIPANGTFSVGVSLNVDLPSRFVAKVALAAGYYVYGDLFREHVDHRQLRDVMNIDPAQLDLCKSAAELGIDHLTLRTDDYLREAPSDPGSEIRWFRTFCPSVKGSVVILMPGHGCLRVAVGLLGQYLGMVNVPARTELFPNGGDPLEGHVMAIVDKKLRRCSLKSVLQQWIAATEPTDQ